METIKEIAVGSWDDLTRLAKDLDVSRGFDRSYAFRGHANAGWRLEPTLYRSATLDGVRSEPSTEELLRLEERLLDRFKQEAPLFLPHSIIQSSHHALDWWPVMRHYGVPTRLLDWTTSFYVAAYFASAAMPDEDGVIIVLHLSAFERAMSIKHPESSSLNGNALENTVKKSDAPPLLLMIGRATSHLDRMVSQQCCFMCGANVATDVDTELALSVPQRNDAGGLTLGKLRIPSSLKPEIMHRLRAMNVTGATLFPGLDGIGKSLDDIVRYP